MICLVSTQLADLKTLRVRYLAMNNNVTQSIIFYPISYRASGTGSIFINDLLPRSGYYGIPYINLIGAIPFVIIAGLNLTAPIDIFDIQLKGSYPDPWSFQLDITTASSSIIKFLGCVGYVFLYNEKDIQTYPSFPLLRITYLTFSNSQPDLAKIMQDQNTFWGLTGITIPSSLTLFSFDSDLTPLHSIDATSTVASNLNFAAVIF